MTEAVFTKPVFLGWLLCAMFFLPLISRATGPALDRASKLEEAGRFAEAATEILSALDAPNLQPAERQALRFELDRLDRIRKDYPHTREELFAALTKSLDGLTQSEFDDWIAAGRFDSRVIDGRRYFMGSSVSNLFFRHPELSPRRRNGTDKSAYEKALWKNVQAIQLAARAGSKPYVLPHQFHVTMTVKAKPDAAPEGSLVRAWLPVPREFPFQNNFALLDSIPTVKAIGSQDSPIRSVHMEQRAQSGRPTVFKIDYRYTTHGIWFDLDPEVAAAQPAPTPELKPFTQEAPHVVFSGKIRELSEQIAGGETNPLVKARRFYDWISENIKYSYALEYSTIRNISDYCLTNRYGDCGQEALLFITLCRYNGIPARWQSGWFTFPGNKTIHDWCEIFIAPYGWVPVDPYMGVFATRYLTTLAHCQRRDIREFYFGGLDQFRMAANSDHSQPLSPPKNSFRSDDVDFQRGELEFDQTNLYFDQYSYDLTIRPAE